jgi:hypothetical protein
MAFKFFVKSFVTIPMASNINSIFIHFMFHMYFIFFSASFCVTFLSTDIATSISMHIFSFLL